MTSTGAALAAKPSPNPSKTLQLATRSVETLDSRHKAYRAPMNIPTELEAVWRMVATIMMNDPMPIAGRRPSPSLK